MEGREERGKEEAREGRRGGKYRGRITGERRGVDRKWKRGRRMDEGGVERAEERP